MMSAASKLLICSPKLTTCRRLLASTARASRYFSCVSSTPFRFVRRATSYSSSSSSSTEVVAPKKQNKDNIPSGPMDYSSPSQKIVYEDPRNVQLPGFTADAPVKPKAEPPVAPEIWERIPTSLMILILALMLGLQYAFFQLEPQLRDRAREQELQRIRKEREASNILKSSSSADENDKSKIEPETLHKIEKMISSYPIVLFMKGTPEKPKCKYSAKMVELLRKYHIEKFESIDVLTFEQPLRAALRAFSRWPSFPQLYIRREFVGGVDVVQQLDESMSLEELLAPARDEMKRISRNPVEEREKAKLLSEKETVAPKPIRLSPSGLRDFSELRLSENVQGCL